VFAAGPSGDTSTTDVTVSDSLASAGHIGFGSYGTLNCTTCASRMTVTNSGATHNSYNFIAHSSTGTLVVSGSRALHGINGLLSESSGKLYSSGNNVVYGNTNDTFGTITSIAGTVFH
jgi:hypothetical protein